MTETESERFRLLWADDEIDLLQPHILYLEQRGYEVAAVHSGEDALDLLAEEKFDMLLLDERMPGLDGLAVLERLRTIHPDLPVVMVTKQEDEGLMEEALGRSITDFLTKPVNPSQVLSVCKRILESGRLREETLTRDYTQEFSRLSSRLEGGPLLPTEWSDLAEALAYWSVQLDETGREGLAQSLASLQQEADGVLARQVIEQYPGWVADRRPWQQRLLEGLEETLGSGSGIRGADFDLPPLPAAGGSHPLFVSDLLGRAVFPLLAVAGRVVLFIIDCMRLDQWMALEPLVGEGVRIELAPVFSLLPSASPYARNALLSGRFPDEVAAAHPDLWGSSGEPGSRDSGTWEPEEEGLNRYEPDLLTEALEVAADHIESARLALFERVRSPSDARGVERRLSGEVPGGLSVVVVNFLDLLVHGQTESAIVQELVPDPAAFRALARQWFEHSPLLRLLVKILRGGVPVILATDHGSIQVKRGVEVKADRTASRGLRYKIGRNLNADSRWTHRIDDLAAWRLPPHRLTTTCLLAREDAFLVFTADASTYRRRFAGSFQHGGISLPELVVPLVRITAE